MPELPSSPMSAPPAPRPAAGPIQGQVTPLGGARLKVGADPSKAMQAIAQIQKDVGDMARGEVDPVALRNKLIRQYYQGLQRAAFPGSSSVRGHREVDVAYRTLGGDIVILSWDYLPGPSGPMLLGLCPDCHRVAPSSAQSQNATRPLFFDGQLARAPGDPDADRKYVYWRAEGLHIELDPNSGLLTVREPIRCPERAKCGWAVRVTDSRAERVGSGIVRPGRRSGGPGGPLIIVK